MVATRSSTFGCSFVDWADVKCRLPMEWFVLVNFSLKGREGATLAELAITLPTNASLHTNHMLASDTERMHQTTNSQCLLNMLAYFHLSPNMAIINQCKRKSHRGEDSEDEVHVQIHSVPNHAHDPQHNISPATVC